MIGKCGEYVCVPSGEWEGREGEVAIVSRCNAGAIGHFDVNGIGADFQIVNWCARIEIMAGGASIEDGDGCGGL